MKIIIALIGLLLSSTFLFIVASAQTTNLPNNFDTIVYQSNGFYYAKDSQNNILVSSGIPEFVIKNALQRGGDIYVSGGTYNLSPSFVGFDIKSNTYLRLAHNAYFVVPSGYAGHVFRFNSDTFQSVIDGGNINEASPVKRNWIGILMQGESVSFNLVENIVINNPSIVIDFSTTSPNYISANTFYNINGNNFVKGIEFDFSGNYILWQSGIFGNTFRDCQFQSGSMTTNGVKDINFQNNAFYNVIFWDLPPNAISANIGSLGVDTIIIGGEMTDMNFEDKGKGTIILDAWHTKFAPNSTQLFSILKSTNSQGNVPTLSPQQVLNMSIIQQAAGDFVKGNHGQLVLSSGQSTVVNIYGTVNNPTGGSVNLDITRPDGIVEQNQADLTSAGDFYYPLTFDKNSVIGQYRIDGSYQNFDLGTLLLNVTSDQTPLSNLPNVSPSIGMTASSQSNITLSVRIKNDAKLWSQGQISDSDFLDSIQYLIAVGTLEKPSEGQVPLNQSASIPAWFKNSAGWWANGQISDNDFFSGVQYLINSGIVQMP